MNFFPEQTGVGKYSGEMAFWLAQNNHDIRVISAPPYYPHWLTQKNYSSWTYKKEIINNVKIFRCPLFIPSKPNGLSRLIHLFSFAFLSMPVVFSQFFWKPDLVIMIEPSLLCSPAGLLLAKISKSKTLLHIQDFEVDAALELGMVSKIFKNIALSIERQLLNKFNAISTISKSMKKKLGMKGIKVNNQFLFPNWSNLNEITHSKDLGRAFRIKEGFNKDDFLILYSGNIGKKQGLELVIESAVNLKKNKKIKYIFCGDGVNKEKIVNLVHKNKLLNCFFYPLQDINEFNSMLNAANIHLVIQKSDAADLVMPSKLTNIIASGGFSIVTAELDTELGNLIENNKFLGARIMPNNSEILTDTINYILSGAHEINNYEIRNFAEQNFEINEVMNFFNLNIEKVIKDTN